MHFEDDQKNTWGTLGDDFVYVQGKKRVNKFIKTVHNAKIETERKMRQELDYKLLSTKIRRLNGSLGDNAVRRLQYYITAYNLRHEPPDLQIKILNDFDNARDKKKPPPTVPQSGPLTDAEAAALETPEQPILVLAKGNDYQVESQKELAMKVKLIEDRTAEVEYRVPMLAQQTKNELSQLKRFILIYYSPILSEKDIDKLKKMPTETLNIAEENRVNSDINGNHTPNYKEKAPEKEKIELYEPKLPGCSKVRDRITKQIFFAGGDISALQPRALSKARK